MASRLATRPIRIESILRRWARRDAHQEEASRKFRFDDMEDLAWPREMWRAVEGDESELIKLLRSERGLSRRTRNAMADWLEDKLTPVRLPVGGYRTQSKPGLAWYRYDKAREFIRRKGWHRKRHGRYWPPERLLSEVAQKEGVAEAALQNWIKRAKPVWSLPAAIERARQDRTELRARQRVAREIRSRE